MYNITKHTAGRIKQYCKAVEQGYGDQFSSNPYTFIELGKGSIEDKLERWTEVKFITGKNEPLRKEIRQYYKTFLKYGSTHNQRMETILYLKLKQLNKKKEIQNESI